MPKALLTLANGTVVTIEGTVPEVHELLSFYSPATSKPASGHTLVPPAKLPTQKAVLPTQEKTEPDVDLMAIVNHVKSCDEAESIEKRILDQTNQLARVLLPMYIVCEHMKNAHGLTSGEISKVTVQLGVPIKRPNVSNTLSGAASKYIIGDTVRKTGQAVRYKLSRRGQAYLKEIITGREAS